MADTSGVRKLNITLVHGTWGGGHTTAPWPAKWFELRSSFCKALMATLDRHGQPYEIKDYQWSGANSVFERAKAAQGLANELAAARESDPHARQLVIAHSHGGNVTLKALQQLGPQPNAEPIGLAALATPFLQIYRVPDDSPREETYADIGIVFGTLMWTFAMAWLGLTSTTSTALSIAVVFGVVFLLMQLILMPWSMGRNRIDRPAMLQDAANYPVEQRHPAEILVVRGVDDEASFALALGGMVARANHLMLAFFSELQIFIRIGSGLLAAVALAYVGSTGPLLSSPGATAGFVLFCITVLMFAGLFVIPLAKCALSRELAWASTRCDIAVNSSPDALSGIQVVTLPQTAASERLSRHSIYQHELCAATVADWAVAFARRPAQR
jgi:hypothetical protein